MARNLLDYLGISLKGVGMGAADVVPGVSGGTIAFITGIYEELINSIKSVKPKNVGLLFSKGLPTFWRAINGTFLTFLLLGIGISIVSLAVAMTYLLEHHPILIWAFFFGLIVASAVYVGRKIKKWDAGVYIGLATGAVAAYLITILTPAETTTAGWFIFVSGAIAICAMILPGISGSFILLLLGKYEFMMNAIHDRDLLVIAIFGGGAVIGLLSFANVLSWLLKRFHNATIAVLTGFMIGSLNKVWPWKETLEYHLNSDGEKVPLLQENISPASYAGDAQLWPAIGLAVAGIAVILAIELISSKTTKKEEQV